MNIKKIRKKHLMLAFIFIVTCITKSVFCMPALPNYGQLPIPSAEEIEEIMQTPDFKNMMDELEKIFAEEDLQAPEKPQPIREETIIPKPRPHPRPQIQPKHQSIEQNFLKPVTQDSAKNKLIQKLPQEKIDAFNYFIGRFLKSINNIEKRINSFEFGISFKEYMENIGLGESINKINVAINQIKSKKLYLKVFFLPINTQLRKEIIDSLKESEKLKKSIKSEEEGEKEISAFMHRMASAEKKATKIKLNPLQKKIENLLNINLKKIDQKISSVAINTQAKEEIEKKKKLRENREKRAIEEQKRSTGRRQSPSYRPSYQQRYQQPRHGTTTKPRSYSGPKSRYSNYSKAYTPRRRISPSYQETRTEKSPDKTQPASRGQSRLPEEMKQKLNLANNLNREIIKLLQSIKEKYNSKKEQESIKKIYESKSLLKIKSNLDKLEEVNNALSEETRKRQTQNKGLIDAIIGFLPLGIKLAKNPIIRDQQEAALKIIELKPEEMKSHLKKYEIQIFKELDGKENLLTSFDTSAQDIKNIWLNFSIINTTPQINTEKIEAINESFKKQYKSTKTKWTNIPNNVSDQLAEITENVGAQNINFVTAQFQQQAQNLNTGTNLNTTIGNLDVNIHNEIKTILTNLVTQIVTAANMGNALTEVQKNKIKEAFNIVIENISAQQRYITDIGKIFDALEKD